MAEFRDFRFQIQFGGGWALLFFEFAFPYGPDG
jgi:hypothetical protein